MKKSKLYVAIGLLALAPLGASANSLLDIYELALKNDSQLKADTAGYNAGKEYGNIARAGLLPQINAAYSYNDTKEDLTDNLTSQTVTQKSKSKGWSATLNQPLFDSVRLL